MKLDAEELTKKIYDKAKEKGANPDLLLDKHAHALLDLSTNAVSALGGDKRLQKHLEAQFKAGRFSLEADAFVESRIWREAVVEVLTEVAEVGVTALVSSVANSLAEAAKETL